MTAIADHAIAWYDTAARDLPWRRPDRTPWGVLVSEVMLQQTQVARVEPVWHEWMRRWPSPADLSSEPVGEAIRAWGRLGYPRRALRLHGAAVEIVRRFDGLVPVEVADLASLPGIGTYTARAVAVFAYGQRHPVVDTNVRRLIARAVAGRPDGGAATSARDLVEVERQLPARASVAARASIAFMELGALVCTAREPSCTGCPLVAVCRWHAGSAAPIAPRVPARRGPGYAGTDRQVRGLLLAVLREATTAVAKARLDAVWPDAVQRERALASLLSDGLVVRVRGRYALP